MVEAYNEASHHLHSVTLNLSDRIDKVTAGVLPFLSLFETCLNGRLDANKDTIEAGTPH